MTEYSLIAPPGMTLWTVILLLGRVILLFTGRELGLQDNRRSN